MTSTTPNMRFNQLATNLLSSTHQIEENNSTPPKAPPTTPRLLPLTKTAPKLSSIISPRAISSNSNHDISNKKANQNLYKFLIYDYLSLKQKEYINIKATERHRRKAEFIVTLKDILQDQRQILSFFEDFLKTQYSEENLDFLVDITRMRQSILRKQTSNLKKYVNSAAPTPINITYHVREGLVLGSKSIIEDDFWNEAIDEVLALLETDQLPKFIQSPEYQNWKKVEHQRREESREHRTLPIWWQFIEAIKQDVGQERLEELLRKGASVHDTNGDGQSALHVGVLGSPYITSFLLERRADPNSLDCNSWSPLHVAADSAKYLNCQLLLAFGSNPNTLTNEGNLPLHYLVKNTIKEGDGEIALKLMEKLSQGVNINQQTIKGETVLHYCLRSKTPLFLEKLLILGASVNTKNK
eukprot:TRINITY_DN469_c0_g1_i2.p1 TRINITY_DN469_c0_g1~~TRINITY_DN469_c0_g1_i2.p1  ORF type:complete len:413 (+),score=72.69 TRINITY_DN469_c0_g1_i2:155-1393(+)